ncbi:rhotekin [Mustelus asterias]
MEETIRILEDLNLIYIRQIALSLQDTDFQKKIDHEIRMRDGACKLLAACTQREQALEAAKSLLTCNIRIMAYMSELQRMKEAQVMQRKVRRSSDAGMLQGRIPCHGRVAISDLRIPLMWKDTDYFKNKGDMHRYAVFALVKIGCDIYDTDMVLVDRTMTDICFENAFLFSSVGPDFDMKMEIYSCCVEEDFSITSAPKKLACKLSSSLGRSAGKKIRTSLENTGESATANGGASPLLLPAAAVPGPKYHLLAQTSLSLSAIHSSSWTQSLTTIGNDSCSFWIPLYGSLCCQLAAQPHCMTQHMISSFLNLQQMVGDRHNWTRMYCVLQGNNLFCYYSPEEVDAKLDAAFTITINKETQIRSTEKDPKSKSNSISITNHYAGEEVTHTLVPESPEEMYRWMEAFWQHFCDMSAWKQCCEELMKIEISSPRKLPVSISKQGASLYHEMAIDSPDDMNSGCRAQAIGSGLGEVVFPPWYVLFENNQKTVWRNIVALSDGSIISNSVGSSSDWIQNQPMDNSTAKTWNLQDFSEVNGEKPLPRSRTFSLDSKLSTLRCQVQLVDDVHVCMSSSEDSSEYSTTQSPVKAVCHPVTERSNRRNIRSKLDPRNWLQTQV